LKCCYHPDQEAEGTCTYCNIPLCKTCLTDAGLNDGSCKVCLRQKQYVRVYNYMRIIVCSLGVGWMVLAFFIFDTSQGWSNALTYGILGLVGAFIINMVALTIFSRTLLSNLEPHQKLFVALSRYSVTGHKNFFTQAVNAMKKIDNLEAYKDALYEQLIAILILQPYDLPMGWSAYLSETFKLNEEEMLLELLTYGREIFMENIFENHHYQAIEPLIEILNKTARKDFYNELINKIMARLESVDLKAIKRSQPLQFAGGMGQQPSQPIRRESPVVLQDKAFLTELKLIDEELEEFLTKENRKDDWTKISEIIEQFELPRVPKNTFEAARSLATQQVTQQQQPGVPATLPKELEEIQEDPSKRKRCAECGAQFTKEQMKRYHYEGISVNVCTHCYSILEKEGHREPKQLAQLRDAESQSE